MTEDDTIHDLYAVDTFHFAGIGNLFVTEDNAFHITFWDWKREPSGLIRLAVKHATCSPSIVPGCAEAAITAIGGAALHRIARPFKMLAS